jgi:hypothetical protein
MKCIQRRGLTQAALLFLVLAVKTPLGQQVAAYILSRRGFHSLHQQLQSVFRETLTPLNLPLACTRSPFLLALAYGN